MKYLKKYKIKTQPIINGYCQKCKIPSVMINGKWYIEERYINNALKWRSAIKALYEIEEMCLTGFESEEQWIKNVRNLRYKTRKYYIENKKYSMLFVGPFISAEDEKHVVAIVREEYEWITTKKSQITIEEAAEQMGISRYRLLEMIKEGFIKGTLSKNSWFIAPEEIKNYYDKKKSYISVYEIAVKIANDKTIFDIENRTDRAQLNAYIVSSHISNYLLTWEDIGLHDNRRNSLYFPRSMEKEAYLLIEQYILNYGKKVEIVKSLEGSSYWNTHLRTRKALEDFSYKKSDAGMAALYEIIINVINCEIMECNNQDITKMKKYAEKAPTKIYMQYLVMFVNFCKKTYQCNYTIELKYKQNKAISKADSTKPYAHNDYYKMAYMTFSDKYINENCLVQKAINSSQNSYVWLFTAMHYVCAWRKSDIEAIPVIELPYDNVTTLKMIYKNIYRNEAIEISIRLQNEINNSNIKPKKTKDRQDERFLTIEIPTSLRMIFGTIYSIYCVQVKSGRYINKALSAGDYLRFFGEKYVQIFGNVPFSNRRANKSFLDEVVNITESQHGIDKKIMGYRVASYARAHVEGQNGISTVTSKYLETKLDGLSVDEILMQLFETGTCSFVPYFLLEIVYGKKLSDLSVYEQTEIINLSGLNAYRTEMLSKALVNAYRRTYGAVEIIFKQYKKDESKQIVAEQMLNNIVNRTALSKTIGISCLCAAKRLPCPFQNRECAGCSYGIYEMSFFYNAMERIRELYNKLANAQTLGEQRKIQMLLDEEALPALVEILSVAKNKYHMDIAKYQKELVSLISTKGRIELDVKNDKW